MPQPGKAIYQIKVTLKDIKPPVWRRIQVRSDIRLDELHLVLQAVMGWSNDHLYQFVVGSGFGGRTYYGEPHPDYAGEMEDASRKKLSQLASGEGFKFVYEYDFGDDWLHELLVEKVLPVAKNQQYPVCLKGKRAGPPEDCGGSWGYAHLLEAIKDPTDPEHEELLEWVDGELDPEEFDLEAVNADLAGLT